jgi:GAF domain-containing protein
MLKIMRRLLAPPRFDDDETTRIAALLNGILWAVIGFGSLYTAAAPFLLGQFYSALLTAAVVAAAIVARQLMLRGFVRGASIILLVVIDLILILSIIASEGVFGASYFSLVLTIVIAGVLLGGRGAFLFTFINSLVGLLFTLFQNALPAPLIPQSEITYFSSLVLYLFFVAALLNTSARGFGTLLKSLRNTQSELTKKNKELEGFTAALESTIQARTAELDAANTRAERRASQFEAVAKVSRAISQEHALDALLPQVTELISRHFGYYHVGVFLLDANSEHAVLIAANSAGGKRMLARNHKLKIGQTGIVGYVAGTGLPRIALDTGADAIYFNNPDLPETRSELALPLLRKANQVIGVLDVQSIEPNAFSQEDVRTLATLADQVSIAIENSKLFEEQERILREAQQHYKGDLRKGWSRFTRSMNLTGIRRRNLKTSFLSEIVELPGAVEAVRSGSVYRKAEDSGQTILTLPIKLREQIVGVLNVRADDNRAFSDDEVDILSAIVERAALSIENARLLEESRRIAERETVIGEISARIGSGTRVEDILIAAVRELGTHISGAQVTVEIGGGGN